MLEVSHGWGAVTRRAFLSAACGLAIMPKEALAAEKNVSTSNSRRFVIVTDDSLPLQHVESQVRALQGEGADVEYMQYLPGMSAEEFVARCVDLTARCDGSTTRTFTVLWMREGDLLWRISLAATPDEVSAHIRVPDELLRQGEYYEMFDLSSLIATGDRTIWFFEPYCSVWCETLRQNFNRRGVRTGGGLSAYSDMDTISLSDIKFSWDWWEENEG